MENDLFNCFSRIVVNNKQRDELFLSKFACKNIDGIRNYPEKEKVNDKENIRPIFFHDTDKIIHSPAYTRYIDKTQVFYLFENDHITHRVLHVQFVSKIGRVIGRCLKLNEDLIEAIALAHDIGHVPFGHEGESILNEICTKTNIGCFSHNVQSVRWLKDLENNGTGWNLSLQVLDGILSHNGELLTEIYEPSCLKTWDLFGKEYKECMLDKKTSEKIKPMTLEGCVVRVSDVIAYVGRDIEDAITLRLIQRQDIPDEVSELLGDSNDKIINTLVMDLIKNSYNKSYLAFSPQIFQTLDLLLKFNYENIYRNSKIKQQTIKISNMFKMLFNKYLECIKSNDFNSDIIKNFTADMPDNYRSANPPERIVIDFISGMTDDYFNHQFVEYFVPKKFGYFIPEESK
jgi:dGTPase